MIIFFTGGGTAGSVTPLLAVAEQLVGQDLHFVGTKTGVERKLMPASMTYHVITAGKLRRYWSVRNVVDLGRLVIAFVQSLWLVTRYQPAVVVSAGSFVSVPIIWAAWWCNIPVVLHQQDVQVGLATRLMQPAASMLTKAFAETMLSAQSIGNPVRQLITTTHDFTLDPSYPTVLIFGGGTGAQGINVLVTPALCAVANVIHSTGIGRTETDWTHPRYHRIALLKENMAEALHAADVVVCRAGLGTLSELAALGKVALVIPMPHSHQEANAALFAKQQACVVLPQAEATAQHLVVMVQALLANPSRLHQLQQAMKKINPAQAAQVLAQSITALGEHVS